ncbi:competence protein CoiA family protein [Lysinibacillus fusiformis]|uniref:competence protein CoiA family protein n=1 Tax=Lysinibacillus fusiformis TaxID=28031 RepID=UPI0030190939
MRDAWHNNNGEMYAIPYNLSAAEIENLQIVARKGTFSCPYCKAALYIRHGDINGTYFSHQHGESCEPSKVVTAAYKRYVKQKKRESHRQELIVTMMRDELNVLSRIYSTLEVKFGYLDLAFNNHIPDLIVTIQNRKYALSVLTDINRTTDSIAAKTIKAREQDFIKKGYKPIWFIERSQLAVDTDKKSLVFWTSEQAALQEHNEDATWTQFLHTLAPSDELIRIMNLDKQHLHSSIEVKSILYITPANEDIALQIYRVIENRTSNPPKATFLTDAYTLSIAEAFAVNNDALRLSLPDVEREMRTAYQKLFLKNQLELQQQEEFRRIETERIEKEREKVRNETKKVIQKIPDKTSRLSNLMQAYKQNN